MKHYIIPPNPKLKSFVKYFWALEYDAENDEEISFNTLVDNSSGIIFQHHNGNSAFYKEGQNKLLTTFVYGQTTSPTVTFSKTKFTLTGVLLKPSALHELLKLNAVELKDQMISINEFSCENLNDQLLNATSLKHRIDILSKFLCSKLQTTPTEDPMIKHSLDVIHTSIEDISVKNLFDMYEISDKQFERRFKRSIGLNPVFYIRVIRFQEALKRMKSGKYKRLVDIAYSLNYSDQSHFIKDIRQFSGHTPRDLAQEVSDFVVNLRKPG